MSRTGNEEIVSTIILGKHGIVYEERDDFRTSLFHKVYKKASDLVRHSINSQIDSVNKVGEYEQLDNIITFIGRRGTGKSSSMLSFMESLKKNSEDDKKDNIPYSIEIKDKKVRFIGLEWIDASLLEEDEDIFEMILAEMLNEFLQLDAGIQKAGAGIEYEVRELHQKFDSIYKKILNLKRRNKNTNYYSNESAIGSLRDLARSSALRKDFEELIKKYIRVQQLFSGRRLEYGEETFLVVAIDDIDMNMDSCFQILEKIQRYLKVHGLIVLLAVNYEQLLSSCKRHFAKLYSDEKEKDKYVSKIAEEYMQKALPSYMRIYLPSLKKRDYDRERLTKAQITIDGTVQEMSIKKAIFYMVEKKIKVRYDSQGRKRHFMEPETLRSLNNQFLFLDSLEDPESKEGNFIEILNHNYRQSMDDLLFRYAYENLPQKERKIFIELSEEDIRRRGEIIISRILSELGKREEGELLFTTKTGDSPTGFIHEFQEESFIYGHSSYGELMRSLFFLGREQIYDKKLVHVLLDMYTLVLTKIFYNYRKRELEEKEYNGNNYRMLNELFGGSAAGGWSLHLIPNIKCGSDGQKISFSGAAKGVEMGNLELPISKTVKEKLEQAKKAVDEDKTEEAIAELIDSMTPQIVLLLFLSEFRSEALSEYTYGLRIKRYNAGENTDDMDGRRNEGEIERFLFKDSTADYNVLNFINNIFAFEKVISDFIQAVILSLKEDGKDMGEQTPEIQIERIKKKLYKNKKESGSNFCQEMRMWTKKYGGMVVPAYSTDIYYNMLKRLARQCRKRAAAPIEKEQLFDYLQGLLVDIRKHLKTSDEYYSYDNKVGESYEKVFSSCPVIQLLLPESKNNEEIKEIKEMYNTFVFSLLTGEWEKNRKLLSFENIGSVMF